MTENQRGYYERRLAEETERAQATAHSAVRAAHLGLAARYSEILALNSPAELNWAGRREAVGARMSEVA